MSRRAMALLLVSALLLTLPACGGSEPAQLDDTQVADAEAVPGETFHQDSQQPEQGRQQQTLTEEQQQVVDQIESDAGGMGQAPDADDYSWQVLEAESQDDGLLITASIYTLLLPSDWEDHYVVEETNNWLSIYSKETMQAGYGGLLCNIVWTQEPMDYAGLPDYVMLGRLTIDGVSYDVVADVIEDTQAPDSGQLREQYLAMQADLPEIFKTIDFGQHADFVPASEK